VYQERTGQKMRRSRAFLPHTLPWSPTIFLTASLSHAAVAIHLGPCETLRRYRKLATSSEVAGRYYHEALALGTDLGMRPLVAHCHLGLGKLSRRIGKRDQARDHLTTTTLYYEMDMRFWLEEADGELKALA
jgi:hypothetical protein